MFVYGTLMPRYWNHDYFLKGNTLSEKKASVGGELWIYSQLPMLVESKSKRVNGYLVELKHSWQLVAIDKLETGYDKRTISVTVDGESKKQDAIAYMFSMEDAARIGAIPSNRESYYDIVSNI